MQELLKKLSEMLSLLSEMTELSIRKKELIIQGDPKELEKLLREETGLLAKMRLIEDERQRAAMIVALDRKLPPMNITVSAILETCASGEKLVLSRLQKDLAERVAELERVNGINRVLLQTQIDIAHFQLENATRPTQIGVQYSGAGEDLDVQQPVNLFDKQA